MWVELKFCCFIEGCLDFDGENRCRTRLCEHSSDCISQTNAFVPLVPFSTITRRIDTGYSNEFFVNLKNVAVNQEEILF